MQEETSSKREMETKRPDIIETTDKIKQDVIILKYCLGSKPKRNRTAHHTVFVKYDVSTEDGSLVRVCRDEGKAERNLEKAIVDRTSLTTAADKN
ncbi:transforming growth factor-beta receptor type i and ii [Holotrichia oblita]|uniref:Transforming growth factor-beta receptor type i and ii n=1 Tax=Holotrichia oblita TaxID=644536 RepID=A0ACB9SWT9_HOLOL|nr:transforming growth factor-beta receptor type i and ii [Holotrichia oblita]